METEPKEVIWLKKEKLKDQKEVQNHKLKLISKIKEKGVERIVNTPAPPISIWKRIKKMVGMS